MSRLIVVLAAAPSPAFASGGAHVVDDAAIETVGVCHLESWVSDTGAGTGLVNAAPACTFEAIPVVEFGGAFQHDWSRGDNSRTVASVTGKWRAYAAGGSAIGLSLSAALDTRTGKTRSVYAVIPVSLAEDASTRFYFNLGGARDDSRRAVVAGAQIERDVMPAVTLMAEAYRLPGVHGVQGGMRWNPGGGQVDIDLLAAAEVDRPARFTLGLTIRS